MKEELLKSVAQPMMIFYAPMGLFLRNLVLSIMLLFASLFLGEAVYMIGAILIFVVLHFVAIIVGKREPHIDNILASRKNIRARTKNVMREDGNKFMT